MAAAPGQSVVIGKPDYFVTKTSAEHEGHSFGPFIHARFLRKATPSILRRLAGEWTDAQATLPILVFATKTADDPKWKRFASMYGFQDLDTDLMFRIRDDVNEWLSENGLLLGRDFFDSGRRVRVRQPDPRSPLQAALARGFVMTITEYTDPFLLDVISGAGGVQEALDWLASIPSHGLVHLGGGRYFNQPAMLRKLTERLEWLESYQHSLDRYGVIKFTGPKHVEDAIHYKLRWSGE